MPPKRKAPAKPRAKKSTPAHEDLHEHSEEGTPIPSSPDRSPSRETSAESPPTPPPAPAKGRGKAPARQPDPTTVFPSAESDSNNTATESPKEVKPAQAPPRSTRKAPHASPSLAPKAAAPPHARGAQALAPSHTGNGKPRLDYNPFDTREWGLDIVDTDSPGYRDALARLRPLFPRLLRSAAVRGEWLVREVRTNVERRALLEVAKENRYNPRNPRSTSCKFVYVKASERMYLRSGPGNPYLGEVMAKDLSRMEIEFRRFVARRDGKPEPITPIVRDDSSRHSSRGRDAMVLHWAFTDLYVHHDVIEVLRLLAFDIGVFRGRPSPSAEDLAAHYDAPTNAIEAAYMYPVDVALEYNPRWADEMDYICRQPGKDGKPGIVPFSAEDPYPPSEMVRHNPEALHHYRKYVRPFMFNWNPTSTRCETDLRMDGSRPPQLASQLGIVFALRWVKDDSGRVFLRRWMRHALNLFKQFSPSFQKQDELTVGLVMRELQRRRPELSPVELLRQAKEVTPHFGMLNLCLDFANFRVELGELQSFAGQGHYHVYMRQEEGDVYVAATARDLPILRPQEFSLIFNATGAFVGPSYLPLKDVDPKAGHGKDPTPSMLHLINQFEAPTPSNGSATGTSADRQGKDTRRRRRSHSRSDNSDAEDGGERSRHQRRRSDERHSPSNTTPAQPQAQPQPQPQAQAQAPQSYAPQPQHPQQQQPVGAAVPAAYAPPVGMPGYPGQPPFAVPTAYPPTAAAGAPFPFVNPTFSTPFPNPLEFPQAPNLPAQPPQQQQRPVRSRHLYPSSLPASSLYDAVVGVGQRQCPLGQTMETKLVEWRAPNGGGPMQPVPVTFVMDHVKREAFVAPAIPRGL